MSELERPTLILSGFMGTGKSTVGRIVAERSGRPFLDLDDVIHAAAGRPPHEILRDQGEPAFREIELCELRRALDGEPSVIAVGGGALLDPAARQMALARARVLTLVARPRTIAERTAGGTPRPLLDPEGASSAPVDRQGRIAALLAARAAAYAESHGRFATDGLSPHEVAATVLRAWKDPALLVALGARSYPVRVTTHGATAVADAVAALDPSSVFVVTDTTVKQVTGGDVEAALGARGMRVGATVAIPAGEEHKHLGAVEHVLTAVVAQGADRDAVIVAHGGGVVSDIAGFAASALLRGVRWVVAPTTLLAMVDASVGGKTGVDLGVAKNAVGAFHQPSAVVIGCAYVLTEAARGYTSGLAEVVKSAAIGDAALFGFLESEAGHVAARDAATVERMVLGSVGVKAGVVGRDEREDGERAVLNFGHTVGHALEAEGQFRRLTHGEAVALGMVAALRVGVRLGVTPAELAARIVALLATLGLPTNLDAQPLQAALPYVGLDKKRKGGLVRFVLLRTLGGPVVRSLTLDELAAALAPDPS